MTSGDLLDPSTGLQYRQVRRRAFWRRMTRFLSGYPQYLLSFEEVQDKLRASSQSYIGVMPVEVNKIAGSVGRYRDFDRAFLPLQGHTSQRWREIAQAFRQGRTLPPVKLYKVGDASGEGEVYFVRDGHHRVSVARSSGAKYIDAEVVAVRTRVRIAPDTTERELHLKAEYTEFLEATNLDRLRPGQDIQFTISGAYQILLEHIGVHRYFLGLVRSKPVSWQEAVASWYDHVYRPVVDIIRVQHILSEFPGRSEADLYLWIIDHHYYLTQEALSEDVGSRAPTEDSQMDFDEAAESFTEEYGRHPVRKLIRDARHLLEEIVDEPLLSADSEADAPASDTVREEECQG
jgi:hypothetical protein